MKKAIRVKTKLVKRQFNQADTTDKVGVVIVASFILPMLVFICVSIPNATITFGF